MDAVASSSRPTALVFGGSRGIGAAVAIRLAREGHAVALTHVSRPDKAAEVVAAIQANGGQAMAMQADSADAAAIARAVEQTVDAFGPLQVAVVDAGRCHAPVGLVRRASALRKSGRSSKGTDG